MTIKLSFSLALVATATALAGCASIAPERPLDRSADLTWSRYLAQQQTVTDAAVDEQWWQQFGDPVLDGLITEAAAGNVDLAIANSRLAEARAERRATIAQFGPRIDLSSSVTGQRQSETGTLPVGQISGFKAENVIFDAGFDASWEVDLFGRNDSRRNQADANVAVRQAERDDALVSLLSEIGRNYFELRLSQGQKAIADRNLALQQQRLAMTITRQHYGEASSVDVTRERAELSSLQAALPPIDAQIRASINAISILLGQQPHYLHARLETSAELPPAPPVIASGLTSDLLRRRPDVRVAEYEYAMAESSRRLSDLALYPTFSLFGSGGVETVDLSDLVDPKSLVANLGALLSWSLYDGGQLSAQKQAAMERSNQAALGYRSSVLTALGDVETGAARYVETGKQVRELSDAFAAKEALVGYSRRRFQAGTNNRFDVLAAQTSAADIELVLLNARAQQLLDLVSLHKALGGGWRAFEVPVPPQGDS